MAKETKPTERPAKKRDSKLEPRISNRRALFDYHILEKVEVGISLLGSEVKSLRQGRAQLGQSFARVRDGDVWLYGCHIEEYVQANQFNHEPTRTRRLLLHRREIRRLEQSMKKQPGTTLIPLEMYFKRGMVKVLLTLAIGKNQADKRASIREREEKRNMGRMMRQRE